MIQILSKYLSILISINQFMNYNLLILYSELYFQADFIFILNYLFALLLIGLFPIRFLRCLSYTFNLNSTFP